MIRSYLVSFLLTLPGLVLLATALAGGLLTQVTSAQDSRDAAKLILDADRVVFLGDSNTHAGHYISWIEAQLRAAGDATPELINLGLPSETCSGLSEPDHPFPRPDVHERLARALDKAKPDTVVICYGMNDGIYYPFDAQRFAAYQQGIRRMIEAIHDSGAKIILMTPPPFDPQPMGKQGKLLPLGAEKYAWFAIYEDYDEVIRRYAEWVLSLGGDVEMVIDIHSPMERYLATQRRRDADYAQSDDGVHFNRQGHEVMAATVLEQLGIPVQELPAGLLERVTARQQLMHAAWLTHVGHQRPGMKPGPTLEAARQRLPSLPAGFQQD